MRLSPLALAVLGGVLAAIDIVTRLVVLPSRGVFLLVLVVSLTAGALGATRADASGLARFIPHALVVPLTVLAQVVAGVIALGGLDETLAAVLGGLLAFLTTIGLNPLAQALPVRHKAAGGHVGKVG